MTIGTSIFLIAVGAIMRYAVTTTTEGFSINTAGNILMIVGALGLVISLIYMAQMSRRRDDVVVREDVVRERDRY